MSSQPPPASTAYPQLPHGAPQLPPFPQLLHIKNEPLATPSASTPISHPSDGHEIVAMSPEEDEEGHDSARGTSPLHGPKEKKKTQGTRRRVVQSCSECRRRKIRCDKKFPCGPCILRNDQARCHEVGLSEKHSTNVSAISNYASAADLATIQHRLDALEASLLKSGALHKDDLDHFLKIIQEAEPKKKIKTRDSEDIAVDDTEGAALTLEHLAFGRSRADGSHAIPHFATRLSSVSRPAPNNDYHLAKSSIPSNVNFYNSPPGYDPGSASSSGQRTSLNISGTPENRQGRRTELTSEERQQKVEQLMEVLGPVDLIDLFFRKTDLAIIALTKLLPSRQRGELLVKAYLEKVDWLHRCMHVPTFLRQCNDLHSLPPERVTQEIALPFLALYFTVCTLGLQFMDASEISKHFTLEEAHTLPDTWYHSARSALWAADFLDNHTMESLQCILLLGVFLNNRDRADAAWALLGAAIKMAQGLGLSRLGAEQQSVDGKPLPMWIGRWESLIQREVGRRIWWNLVFLDWSLAPSYNFSCSIQPDQIKTALPANIEDEDIIDGQPLKPQPLSVRTGMSFQLARLRFAEISQRQIWQANNNNHPPYSFVLSVDGELRKAMMELPSFFQPDQTTKVPPSNEPKALVRYYEKTILNLAIHSRMLRLHRPWLSRGYKDERFAYSKEQCIRAARASLRMMSDGTASYLEKWWLPLFYVSVSGLVRTSRKDMFSSETQEKISEVKNALDQMRKIADVSHPSRAAVRVMELLLAEVEERRKPPGSALGKRKSSPDGDDEESGLQRAVKKLIHQAQLEAVSPSASLNSGNTPQDFLLTASPARDFNDRDRDRERPVFDAYPMPFIPVPPTINNATTPSTVQQPQAHQIIGVGNNSPFTFPVDTTSATAFPAFDTTTTRGSFAQTQLDPAVQSILSSYFPPSNNNNGNGNGIVGSATAPQAPDDFLSRVFGFGWDGVGTTGPPALPDETAMDIIGNQGQSQNQTSGGGGQQNQGQKQPGQLQPPRQQPGAQQQQEQQQHLTTQQQQAMNLAMTPNPYAYGNWTNSGWMA
ncbi:nuclear protein [Cryptococcus deuterogattii R265]|uniref:nuclear protein n=1 Tax=Cryptococcus deuterogattii (strain R265) TaxID=294750 RepID=UPI0019351BC8|nr:nuclear protein [Cryptococcus deuterogattii R265]